MEPESAALSERQGRQQVLRLFQYCDEAFSEIRAGAAFAGAADDGDDAVGGQREGEGGEGVEELRVDVLPRPSTAP